MNRNKIESFGRSARTQLQEQINSKIDQILSGSNTIAYIENSSAVAKLKELIEKKGQKKVVEECAYTWFNRLCALRYMDAHHYNPTLIVSPKEGRTLPEILADAMEGIIDESVSPAGKQKILGLLSGNITSLNPQSEIYRILLVSKCNALNKELPFLFEQISDYTDLLLPDDLLSSDSIVQKMLETLDDENCESVEVVGWLYQYYISEKKNEVFAGFKKGKKAGKDEIPAATQLFTPNWIVRYLAENTLGKLWLLNHPESMLKDKMDFYVEPAQKEQNFISINDPSEIKLCDPCCGSGHMLTYAFDLLFEIYSEYGYPAADAVSSIIKNNLFGIELDKRAGQLSYFALMMKAREKDKRFFSRGIEPNICVLEPVSFEDSEINEAMELISKPSLFVMNLLNQFKDADELGSLIKPDTIDLEGLESSFKEKSLGSLFDTELIERIKKVFKFTKFLSPRYNIVITNPPYMGNSHVSEKSKNFIQKNYADYKSDMFSAFIVRCSQLTVQSAYLGFMTPYVWMFISSYEKLRSFITKEKWLSSLAQLEYSAFKEATVPLCIFTIKNKHEEKKGSYFRLTDFRGGMDVQKEKILEAISNQNCGYYYETDSSNFEKIPGSPIAYWASKAIFGVYDVATPVVACCQPLIGLQTGDNGRFLRHWYEIYNGNACYHATSIENALQSGKKWFPYNKGGDYRKWFGNDDYVVNWKNDGEEIRHFTDAKGKLLSRPQNTKSYFHTCITWSKISSGKLAFRFKYNGSIYDVAGPSIFGDESQLKYTLAFLNSNVSTEIASFMSPTLNFEVGQISNYPLVFKEGINNEQITLLIEDNISLSKSDWDSFETSWDFTCHPFVRKGTTRICDTWAEWQQECQDRFEQLKANEEELNRIFIDIYGLQDELTPEEEDSDVTVRKADLARDMRSFVSYAVGCMFGRYSLDCDGLAYAGGDWDSSKYSTFLPDEDNVIPVLDDEWFNDDIVGRFKKFVRTVFGSENYDANMNFIEKALGRNIRDYFMKEFYKDHLKVYQKRPIYWMFSSPEGNFNVLVYLHRYNKDTANVVLKYMRDYRTKIQAQLEICKRNHDPEEIKYQRIDKDLENYDSILYSLALNHIDLDLDDGVKVNYGKIGKALFTVEGLNKEKK